MTPKLADYIEAGKALGADERLEAAHQLLLSVEQDADSDPVAVDTAWDQAIDRRVQQILNREAEVVDGPQAHAQVRAEIAARRK